MIRDVLDGAHAESGNRAVAARSCEKILTVSMGLRMIDNDAERVIDAVRKSAATR